MDGDVDGPLLGLVEGDWLGLFEGDWLGIEMSAVRYHVIKKEGYE